MRTAYDGPAAVLANGTEHPVNARLWVHAERVQAQPGEYVEGMKSWGGTLTGLGEAAAWSIHEAGTARLRVGDREGDFLLGDGDLNGGSFAITGSGPAPFNS